MLALRINGLQLNGHETILDILAETDRRSRLQASHRAVSIVPKVDAAVYFC